MSAFEVSLTPTRTRNTVKKNEAREPVNVVLAPFSAKSTVVFHEIPVTKTARRYLNIYNPSEHEIKIMVTKRLKPEYNIQLEWTSNVISPRGTVAMEIVWNPLHVVACNETLQLTDSRNFKKDVTVILKSIKKFLGTKALNRFPSISRPVKDSQSPRKVKKSQQQPQEHKSSQIKLDAKIVKTKDNISPLYEKNEQNNSVSPDYCAVPNFGKENISPSTPNNASDIFDKIKFTPATETKSKSSSNLEYLASLPTPVNHPKADTKLNSVSKWSVNPRRLVVTPSPEVLAASSATKKNYGTSPTKTKWIPKVVAHSCSPTCASKAKLNASQQFEPAIYSTTSKRIPSEKVDKNEDCAESRRKLFKKQPQINKTFDLKNNKSESFDSSIELSREEIGTIYTVETESVTVMNTTATLPSTQTRMLPIINEEDRTEVATRSTNNQRQETFDVIDKNLLRDVELVGTPLRKPSESMKNLCTKNEFFIHTQGSMPNLNEMESIQSIDRNRYFHQQNIDGLLDISENLNKSATSVLSAHEVFFNEHDILAQSSRFNINEMINKTIKISPSIKVSKTPSEQGSETIFKKRSRESTDSPDIYRNNYLAPCQQGLFSIAVSPPKRTKIDTSAQSSRAGTNFRTTKWSQTQPKKLKLIRSATVTKKSTTPRKIKTEPRIMLYDSDLYLQSYINPDPFAATTTCDPFLASTMYLDERSVNKNEQQFKKWLNALVTIPAELDPDCSKKTDVGRLFNEVRSKDLILAPTKEEQSMNYLTKSRMEALRNAAIQLFHSNEMKQPCSKIAVYINKGIIEMRKDRDLHLDVVMQRYILELLLNFNPLWLRIGLEVIFAEIIHLHSNADVIALSTFILNRLFRDIYMEKKHPRAYTLSDQYASYMKKYTLQKFLFLLLFLDKAKNNRIIAHNPCLFVKNSKYKETKEILQRFSSELLANVGDITRNLRRMGYVLTHKQIFIDEFNYAFNNLAVDLRDGIRLTRVMEIILLRDDLTRQLRAPAISRLQRVFNVNLALKALAEADFVLKGDICSTDIVDGHREKTLSLLWQIIYKFRSPKFNAAARILQKWWRLSWLKVVIQRRVQFKLEVKRNRAATVIQSVFRGYVARKFTKEFKRERINSAICLQKNIRRYLARKYLRIAIRSIFMIQRWYQCTVQSRESKAKYLRLRNSAIRIQRWYRCIILARKLENVAPIIREYKTIAKIQYEKAIVIQRSMKSYIIHRKLQSIVYGIVRYHRKSKLSYRSASRIQSFFKMLKLRKDFITKRQATITIQRFWRSYRLAKTVRHQFVTKQVAIATIQTYFRNYLRMKSKRNNYRNLKSSAITIQRIYRAKKAAMLVRLRYLEIRQSTITIQRYFRTKLLMKDTRSYYLKLRSVTLKIQQQFRANRLMCAQRSEYRVLKSATIAIQNRFRTQMLMRQYRSEYIKLKLTTILIQRKLRATLLARKVRLEFLSMQYHTILVQQRFRANKLMAEQRTKFLQLQQATVFIQRKFRAIKSMQAVRDEYLSKRNAAIVIQNRFKAYNKMKIIQARYLGILRAAVCIQQRFKEYLLMKKIRKEFLQQRSAAIAIQQQWRAQLLMKAQRSQYLRLKLSALAIQQQYRAYRMMKINRNKYLKLRDAVAVIQRNIRANIARNKYQNYRKCSIIIQQWYRSIVLGKIEREKFKTVHNAAIVLQAHYRAHVQMTITRTKYLQLVHATICIQRRWRANKLMKILQFEYQNLRNNTIYIQRKFRAKLITRYVQKNYLMQKSAAIVIQRRFRAQQKMKLLTTQYLEYRTNLITIQKFIKSVLIMRRQRNEFIIKKLSAIRIQQWFKRTILLRQDRSEYLRRIKSIECIQKYWLATVKMRVERRTYLHTRIQILKIQRTLRSYLYTKTVRSNFLQLKECAIMIQLYYRAYRNMLQDRQNYLTLQHYVVCIQRRFRALQSMREERIQYLKIRSATIFVQQKYRGLKLMQYYSQAFVEIKHSALGLQRHVRGWLARRRFNAMMTPEMRAIIKQKQAAKVIQRYWRGYYLRKTHQNAKMRNISKRINELKQNANSHNTVKNQLTAVIRFLQGRFMVTELLNTLIRLENMSRTVPHILKEHTKFLASFCYGLMAQAIRSEPDKQIIELCSRVILNLARYEGTKEDIFQEYGLVTIAQMLLRWCDKECGIFNTLCTLVWVYIQCSKKRRVIRKFMTTRDAMYMLRETKKLVMRKEKMRLNARKPTQQQTTISRRAYPNLGPDFGVIKNKPYIFICPVFAFDAILATLNIVVAS